MPSKVANGLLEFSVTWRVFGIVGRCHVCCSKCERVNEAQSKTPRKPGTSKKDKQKHFLLETPTILIPGLILRSAIKKISRPF